FSGTGATVLTNVEDPQLVPRAILFWRSETHFLGGLGIMVLFVAILGMGSAGKTLMLAEMPGPSKETAHERTQRAAWVFATIFITLTAVLTAVLIVQDMSVFDALCHAFGTIATGGFSTHNKSIEFFDNSGIEMTIALFMFMACINFTLLYYVFLRRPGHLLADAEFRVYAVIVVVVSLLIIVFGLSYGDFTNLGSAAREGVFQVVSIITNTGFGTANFDHWNSFSRAVLFLLMFVGGCAGSTSCSIKVVRHILFFKVIWIELEKIFHPSVVRHVRLGGHVLPDPDLRKDVLVYFAVILLLFIVSWMLLVGLEPDTTWIEADHSTHDKLMDCASAVAATLNGVGPGLGIVGEAENYSHFHWPSKLILTAMMLLGRLEVFVLVVLFVPRFWRMQ
ncbi:MAG: TrkH family potassium uptake protein, partial [Pirellulales bacterium]|nr:TrkH family potassium uptake protein [Pirellulales bacterium]